MSPLVEWTGYSAVCNACGTDLVEALTGGEFSAWGDKEQAVDSVRDAGGAVIGGGADALVLCEDDLGRYLGAIGERRGDEAEDHARDVLAGHADDGVELAAAFAWAAARLAR